MYGNRNSLNCINGQPPKALYPRKLNRGDTVGIIAPCSPVGEDEVPACIEAIIKMGFKCKIADNLSKNLGGYMAGTGKERAYWINEMFRDPEVDAIFCIRGGDGGTRAAPYIDLDIVRSNPKIFLGYSDVTTMHLLFNQSCGLVTFHGPMVASNMADGLNPISTEALWRCLNGDDIYEYRAPEGIPLKVLKPGRASGKIVGGNLSLLSAAVGTPYDPETEDSILFIEEVSEPINKIEKWMCHLKNAGKFDRCRGVVLGAFTDIHNYRNPEYDEYCVIRDILEDVKCPVMYNISSGHCYPMVVIPLGSVCTMDTEKSSLTFEINRV